MLFCLEIFAVAETGVTVFWVDFDLSSCLAVFETVERGVGFRSLGFGFSLCLEEEEAFEAVEAGAEGILSLGFALPFCLAEFEMEETGIEVLAPDDGPFCWAVLETAEAGVEVFPFGFDPPFAGFETEMELDLLVVVVLAAFALVFCSVFFGTGVEVFAAAFDLAFFLMTGTSESDDSMWDSGDLEEMILISDLFETSEISEETISISDSTSNDPCSCCPESLELANAIGEASSFCSDSFEEG